MNCIKGIENLNLKLFWKNFDKILSIPRPSYHEHEIVEYLKSFSDYLGYTCLVDNAGNTIIRKPASKGKENCPGIILQAHLDMVPQKNEETEHDFLKDPIKAFVEDGWIKTYGTTLGADNGTGVAGIMSILEDKDIEHGPIEALFTVQEEVGLKGAGELKSGVLKGKYFINLDGGPDNTFVIGCAGGVNSEITFKYQTDKNYTSENKNLTFLKITVKGLKGGHSGGNIQDQRGNANKILFRILYKLNEKFDIRLSDINSGGLRNAIPREGFAVISINCMEKDEVINTIGKETGKIKSEFSISDPGVAVIASEVENTSVIDKTTHNNLISAIHICHCGVIRFFDDIPGFAQTSTNLASVKLEKDTDLIKVLFMTRSAVQSLKDEHCSKIDALFKLAGAEAIEHSGSYPGWTPVTDSVLLNKAVALYENINGIKPVRKVVHGGLECGIIGDRYPGLEMISTGADIQGEHSPEERLNIASMERSYAFIVKLIGELAV